MKHVLFLLGHLSDRDIEWMINSGHKENIEAGDFLIHRNEKIENLYIILSGYLSILDGISNIREIAQIGSGEVLGEMSFVESRLPSVSVMATQSCEVFVLSKELIRNRMDQNVRFQANFYYALALFLSDRLRKTTNQLGYGDQEDIDVIDTNVLEEVAQAGSRFSQIVRKFAEI